MLTSYTLFLDRDGVINHEKPNDYIKQVNEFRFYEQVPEAIAILTQLFSPIFIVTNQKGVGRQLMTEQDLHDIHQYMLEHINNAGGKIEKIYYCTDTDSASPNRKPNAGMAFTAKNDYPHIDLNKSIMVGNKLSDMEFGRNAGMKTVFLATTNPETTFPNPLIDFRFNHLMDFAQHAPDLFR